MIQTDILLAGSGCSALYFALNLPQDLKILLVTKKDFESSDSYLAQGGICMLKDESDFDLFFEDTMKAGHRENDPLSVEIMISSSHEIIRDLISYGVNFAKNADGSLAFTREGGHSSYRILYHEDVTGKEITSHLMKEVRKRTNIIMEEYTRLVDLILEDDLCYGGILRKKDGSLETVFSDYTVLATGGIGGLYQHSTNFPQLTGDAIAIALKNGIQLQNINYIQVHPTTLYTQKNERSFLISESVRGEGALLLDQYGNRFTDELAPRDVVSAAIKKQMEKDGTAFVYEDLRPIGEKALKKHFPNILEKCQEEGYDALKGPIPVVPAQHYYMGGVKVNHNSKSSLDGLYAIGECACNNVHGKNRLASNSLLESLVFAKRAAYDIRENYQKRPGFKGSGIDLSAYQDEKALEKSDGRRIIDAIEKRGGASSIPVAYRADLLQSKS